MRLSHFADSGPPQRWFRTMWSLSQSARSPFGSTRQQLERVLNYYEQKIVPSSRESESLGSLRGGDQGEAERWFEKLPLFLREDSKRFKVVKALRDALNMFLDRKVE